MLLKLAAVAISITVDILLVTIYEHICVTCSLLEPKLLFAYAVVSRIRDWNYFKLYAMPWLMYFIDASSDPGERTF